MLSLNDPISAIKGIGPKQRALFAKLNIFSVGDLLYHFPNGYQNRRNVKTLDSVSHMEKATIIGTVCGEAKEIRTRKRMKLLKVPIKDSGGIGFITFFNSPFLKKVFRKNETYYFYGNINIVGSEIQLNHPEYCNTKHDSLENFCSIRPQYGLTKGLTQKKIISNIDQIVLENPLILQEYLPSSILESNSMCDIGYAIRNIHFPSSPRALKVAKYRLVFEELFFMQLGLIMIKKKFIKSNNGITFEVEPEFNDLVEALPFKLTNAQQKTLNDIISDMQQPKEMNRLIQGDVGSGKTIIALLSMYLAFLNGYQSTLMAPTEILAEQHFKSFKSMLEPLGVNVGILSRSVKNKEEVINQIKDGKLDMVVGTHALIQDKIQFHKLGLVVTDEQHRFGVRQRSFLKQKGSNPDVLVMSATPIPRTLSLILYGDLDISIIDELPPGRKHIKTHHITSKKVYKLYDFIKEELNKGRQAYIVCPLVEESEKIDAESAVDLYNDLSETTFKSWNLALIHGKMKADEKDNIMKRFEAKEIDLLISTSVIEVGINVPNATIMTIVNAERFGLAQLHQLRGRVGRGQYQSYCFLISEGKNNVTKERMKTMESTNNGFVIAEKDLELRGPGDFFGTKQHGLPELKIADIFKHKEILKKAQKEAFRILEIYKLLDSEEKKRLKYKVRQLFGDVFKDFTI
ncbi:ATP-dependent DNA helicase RecG [Wukongibacter baidiensis]|uniref:ATP-dependent DNA helicase RecG n=1 Tax=Wukongibacter baidiensis TaxID=1723361 RepID=UPI003D7F300B